MSTIDPETRDPNPEARPSRRGLLAAGLVAALAALVLGLAVLPHAPLPDWDEATYAFSGKYLRDALAHGHPRKFFDYTKYEMEKPFLHSWMLVPAYALFPATPNTARGLSLACYAACATLLFRLVRRVAPRRGRAAPAVAVAFFLASPIVMQYALLAMLELPGTFFTLATLLVFLRAREKGTLALHAWVGVLLAATFLLKYNYGVVLVLAFAAELAVEARRKEVGLRPVLALAAPFAASVVLWFSDPYPEKLRAFLAFTVNRANVDTLLSWPSLAAYPLALVREYHFLGALAALTAAGLVGMAVRSRTERGPRTLLLAFGINLALVTLHPYKLDRNLIPVAPVLFAAAGIAIDAAARRAGRAGGRAIVGVLLVLATLAFVGQTARMAGEARARVDPFRAEALAAVIEPLDRTKRNLVLGEFNELSPDLIHFYAFRQKGREFPLDVGCRVPDAVFDRRGVVREFRPSICESVAREIAGSRPDVLVYVDVPPGSPYWPDDYETWNAWKRHIPACLAARADFREVATREFGPGVMTVRVYKKQ